MTKAYDNSLLARNINVSGVNTSVSGLLSVTSGNFIDSLQVNGVNVSISGHNHTASQITDFSSSVSGLLPVTNIVAGTNITVTSSSGSFTINSTASGSSSDIDAGTYPLITISSQPSETTIEPSSNATFSVTATVSSPASSISYQWQESTNNSSWSNVSGATSSILTLTSVQSDKNGYYYRCNLQSLLSNIYSNSAILTVTTTLTPTPTITSTPTPTVTPSGSGGAKFTSFNSIWNGVGFTGSGTSSSPYTKAAQNTYNAAGMQFTVVSTGTLRITCTSMYSDFGIDIFKNGALQGVPPSIADANGGNGGNYNVNITMSVAANDVIRIGTALNDYIYWNSTINIWWQ